MRPTNRSISRDGTTVRHGRTTHTVTLGAETLVVNRRDREVHVLDPVATRIWRLLDGSRSVNEVAVELEGAVDGAGEAVRHDLMVFLDRLSETDLIEDADMPPDVIEGTIEHGPTRQQLPADRAPFDGSASERQTIREKLGSDLVALEIASGMHRVGIRPILLKGASISAWLYENPAQRPYKDIDLLVAPIDVATGEEVLRRHGFVRSLPARGRSGVTIGSHATVWHRASDDVTIDFHHRLAGPTVDPTAQWEILSRRRDTVELVGVPVDCLDLEGRLLHICLHLAQDHNQRPKKFGDLSRAIETATQEQWTGAAELARALGASAAMGAGLRQTSSGSTIARRLDLPVADDLELVLRSSGAPKGAVTLLYAARAGSPSDRFRYLFRIVFPSRRFMEWWAPFPVEKRRALAWAYLRRAAWLLRRTPRAVRAVLSARIGRDQTG